MRTRWILGLVVAASVSLALAAAAVAAVARTPFTQAFDNPCTGEALVATGTMVTNSDVTIGADGKIHVRSNVHFEGMAATNPVSGHKYIVQEQTLEGQNSDSDLAPSTTHFKIKIHWVRTGEDGALIDDDDFYDWFHVHTTVNANGVPTSTTIDVEDDVCR